MSDIFISYASEDRQRARILAQALEQLGWSVWWDRTIPAGRTFAEVIEEALANARCVMVLWSRVAIKKGWVREEADEGKKRNILIPVLIDQVDPPFGFRSIQAADLIEWQGAVDAPGFKSLVKDTARMIGEPPTSINEVVAKSEEKIRQKTQEEQKRAEEAARKAVAEKAARKAEAERKKAEEEKRKAAEAEKRRAEEEANQKVTEETRRAEAAARLKAEQEARHREEEAKKKAAAEEERKRTEQAARKTAEEETRLRKTPYWIIVVVVGILLVSMYIYNKRQEYPAYTPVVESKREIAQEPVWKEPFTGMEFVLVPGGCYEMGDTFGDGEADEKPVHRVCVDDFYLSRHETTVGQFKLFVSETRYRTDAEKGDGCYLWTGSKWEFKKESNWKTPGFPQNDNHPVVCVSWRDAQEFTRWLTKQSGKELRLPTEAEWEYAARSGGKKEKWAGTSTLSSLKDYAWFSENSGSKTQPAGELSPNGLGLYDMSGNVSEWVNDWYDKKYYSKSPEKNPQGPASDTYRVLRGGSWYFDLGDARCAYRVGGNPDYRDFNIGFRCARTKK